jgi:hypothetical protein
MDIHAATRSYERWIADQIPLIRTDLARKHREMKKGAFPFLRGAFYRWAQMFPQICVELMDAPTVLGIGDLHVENFGTWRDAEGRLVWGVNDFDEACYLPYTSDLVRLVTSTVLAAEHHDLNITAAAAAEQVLRGYRDALDASGLPFVLAERHEALREMAVERLKHPETFWEKLDELSTLREKVPGSARKGLERQFAERDLPLRMIHRTGGLGALGHRRYTAIATWRGGRTAREAKELAVSAWTWAHNGGSREIYSQKLLDCAIRCRDPFVRVRGKWTIRRLAPDCSRVELGALPSNKDTRVLLRSMGWETANVHLGTAKPAKLLADLRRRGENWLEDATRAMVKSTVTDWKAWRR